MCQVISWSRLPHQPRLPANTRTPGILSTHRGDSGSSPSTTSPSANRSTTGSSRGGQGRGGLNSAIDQHQHRCHRSIDNGTSRHSSTNDSCVRCGKDHHAVHRRRLRWPPPIEIRRKPIGNFFFHPSYYVFFIPLKSYMKEVRMFHSFQRLPTIAFIVRYQDQ
jgi:hypothetical protein